MNKEAIQQIQKTANMVEMNQELNKVGTHVPTMLVPEGFKVIDLEDQMKLRANFRFNFSTKSIRDFVDYSKEFDKQGAKCFVDSDSMSAKVIFDIGTEAKPEHQRNKANLQLNETSAYKAVLRLDCEHLSQKDTANFIEDWADLISIETGSGEPMTIAQASNALTSMTIESARQLKSEVGDFSESLSAMERVEVANKGKMPSRLKFICLPYLGLAKRELNIRLSILTGGNRPEVSLRIVGLEPLQEDIAEEFKELLVEEFTGSKLQTFIGNC